MKLRSIYIKSGTQLVEIHVTHNLHAALTKLRDPHFERILWVDALCIDQKDDKEKAHQVGAMAKIYSLARRVVVWLGEESVDSALAFQTLEGTAPNDLYENQSSADENDENDARERRRQAKATRRKREQAVLALLNRAYFRRMWVSRSSIRI